MSSNLALTLEPCQCQVCHTRAGLKICSDCKVVFYCGREHQASDRRSHKHACTAVKEARNLLYREEMMMRIWEEGDNLLEDSFGQFWSFVETHDYMRARYIVAEETLAHFRNVVAVETALKLGVHTLRLGRTDNCGMRALVSGLYLRLGYDRACYDFVKWWATTGQRDDYDWDNMEEPYCDVRGADVLESPEGLWPGRGMEMSHSACVALIKVRILLDLQQMQNATRALRGALPRELVDEIRGWAAVSSSAVASRKDIIRASAERTAELIQLVKDQIRMLFDAIASYDPTFWPAVVDEKRPGRIFEAYEAAIYEDEEAALMVMYNYDAWRETPGSIGIIESLMKAA